MPFIYFFLERESVPGNWQELHSNIASKEPQLKRTMYLIRAIPLRHLNEKQKEIDTALDVLIY